ncbi:MAG: imidazolonepropionase [Polyangiaceae bacterium]
MSSLVVYAGRVVTADPSRAGGEGSLHVLSDAGVVIDRGVIQFVGPRWEVAARAVGAKVLADAPGSVITPGLCDAHTHAAYAGSRHGEYAARLGGASYEDIARAGGGILSTRNAVQAATTAELTALLAERLLRMAALGVTTVEVKSGYGLDDENEGKQLQAIAEAASRHDLPRVVATYLALHALPKEAASRRAAYVDAAVLRVGNFAARGLMRYVDAYVDQNAFTVAEAERLGEAARTAGLGIRLHVGQFADVGGAALAARLGAATADHLENIDAEGATALARAGTRAVLLPVASFTLAQSPPPVELLRRAGVPLIVASDATPGTAPTESLPLALAFAVRLYGLTPDEAIAGATREAAHSLGLGHRVGMLKDGVDADLVLWDLPHEYAIVQPWGTAKTKLVLRGGAVIAPHS